MTSNNFKLSDVTEDQELIEYCHRQNAVTWGSDLYNTDQYVLREEHLKDQTICSTPVIDPSLEKYRKYLGARYFAFLDLSLPAKDKYSQIVSSCETLNRVGYIQPPGSTRNIPSLSVCIGGVFTPAEFRGKGYASAMMEHLNKFYDDISTSNGPDDSFLTHTTMFLYSEVGDFYEKFGYQSRHIPVHEFINDESLADHITKGLTLDKSQKDVTPLNLDHDDSNLEHCLKQEINECESLSACKDTMEKYRFYMKPDLDIYKWFKARDVFISNIAFSDLIDKHPLVDGYKIKDTNSHIIWHHNWNESKLYVLKLYIEDNKNFDDLTILLVKCLEELNKYNIKKMVLWDDDLKISDKNAFFASFSAHSGVHLNAENGSLSAIRAAWIDDINKLEWINNSKYLWF
ncbi:unnamed protein product [Hanseniaspora opuntiae]